MDDLRHRTLGKMSELGKTDHNKAAQTFFSNLCDALRGIESENYFLFAEVQERRPNVDVGHLCWLLFCAYQYLEGFRYDDIVDQDPGKLGKHLRDVAKEKFNELVDIASTRFVGTNIAERYRGLQIILSMIDKGQSIKVLDIGCSYGLGLMSLNTDFMNNIDFDDRLLNYFSNKRPDIHLHGIDANESDFKWLLACYLPEYGRSRDNLNDNLQRLSRQGSRFQFHNVDISQDNVSEHFSEGNFDVIWTSNMCYELEGDIAEGNTYSNINMLLSENGIWVHANYRNHQTFCEKEQGVKNDYVVCVYKKNKLRATGYEVLVTEDHDKAEIWKRGDDFDKFFSITDVDS